MTATSPNQGSEKRGDVMLQLGYSCMGEKNMYCVTLCETCNDAPFDTDYWPAQSSALWVPV